MLYEVITSVTVKTSKKIAFESTFTIDYTIFADGRAEVSNALIMSPNIRKPELPRLGSNLIVDQSLAKVQWFGRGIHENYSDRKSSAFAGVYSSTVDGLNHDYVRPQENGYHTDTRWVSFDNGHSGLYFEGEPQICFGRNNFV